VGSSEKPSLSSGKSRFEPATFRSGESGDWYPYRDQELTLIRSRTQGEESHLDNFPIPV